MNEPYYEDDLVTLYHGDCREVTGSLDAWLEAEVLVTDPPYGTGGNLSMSGGPSKLPGHRASYASQRTTHAWDVNVQARDVAIAAFRDKPYAVFGSPRRLDLAPPHRQAPLIWDKGDSVGMGDTTFPWRPSYELIYVNGDGWSGHRGASVIRCPIRINTANEIGHPTPKPVGLMELLIAKAPPGAIADPFAGSGSTLVAAKQLGRRAIGVELEEEYCEIAARRLAQDTLFGGVA